MPILHDVAQRSEAWDMLRLGVPTASCFSMIVTPGGDKPWGRERGHAPPKISEQWERYADHLLAERYLKRQVDTYTSPQMERGAEVEDHAADWYEFKEGVETRKIGFISADEYIEEGDGIAHVGGHRWYRYGASPDRLVGEEGLLEIKCPGPAGQMNHLRTGVIAKKYRPQLQGQLWVSGRQWVDVVSWHEEMPRIVIRVERDNEFIEILEREVNHFADEIDEVYARICGADGRPVPVRNLKERLRASLEASV